MKHFWTSHFAISSKLLTASLLAVCAMAISATGIQAREYCHREITNNSSRFIEVRMHAQGNFTPYKVPPGKTVKWVIPNDISRAIIYEDISGSGSASPAFETLEQVVVLRFGREWVDSNNKIGTFCRIKWGGQGGSKGLWPSVFPSGDGWRWAISEHRTHELQLARRKWMRFNKGKWGNILIYPH